MRKSRVRNFTLSDDKVAIIDIALRFLLKNGNTSDDVGVDDYENKLKKLAAKFARASLQ
jgi:hypothetical protein